MYVCMYVPRLNFQNSLCRSSLAIPPNGQHFGTVSHLLSNLSKELSEIDKFQYFISMLVGTAAETISGLPLSGSNYNYAVDLLMKQLGSKQVIISKHIEMLMQLPKLNNSR